MRYDDIQWPDLRALLPAGQSGDVRVLHSVVSEVEAREANFIQILKAEVSGASEREKFTNLKMLKIRPGPLTRLVIGHTLFMSDAEMERITSAELVLHGRGRVLIAGLGLGMVLHPLCSKPGVEKVIVVEQSVDVIKLVAPSVPAKTTVIQGDIFKVAPKDLVAAAGGPFDTIFFDIWPSISTSNLPEMRKLHRRFARSKAPGGWMTSWVYEVLRRKYRREERRLRRQRASVGGDPMKSLQCSMPSWA